MPRINTEHRTIITAIARRNGLAPAALLAVVDIESAGRVGTIINGTLHPTIRFEGHYFDRRLTDAARLTARAQGLADPAAGAIKNPRAQADRYRLLYRAKQINADAAIESTSWGVGQVMGSHWQILGYRSAADFADQMHTGLAGQVEAMVRFIAANQLDKALQARDWVGFARRYNGPAYAKNKYDTKLAQAYQVYATTSATVDLLKRGAFGTAVKNLQEKLVAAGYAIATDGVFGTRTAHALKAFQSANGLDADGVYGPATAKMLALARPKSALTKQLNRLIAWLRAFNTFFNVSKK